MREQESTFDSKAMVEDATRQIDLVASWETLLETYRLLEFSDPINDVNRMEEFKWVVKEINKFLTRMRTKLLSCTDLDAMIEALRESMNPQGKVTIDSRKALAYQKLRQQWIVSTMRQMITMREEQETNGR